MILYIARHAWAGHYGDPEWPDDFQRPLSTKGRERFSKVAAVLADRGARPTLIATSPLIRCRQTAELLAQANRPEAELVELDALQPGSDLPTLVEWTAEQAKQHDTIAWVGHAPDVGRMTAALVGPAGWIRLAKGATAAVRFYDEIQLGSGELHWLVTAKMLGC
ncbi:MAG: histidine phosphatase family protein [Pirellulales bacterium]|nr:histidine phosphatase family protein [Pirellulales bacterium]